MAVRFLLDTHILVRWHAEPRRLTREQARVLRDATRQGEQVAISAMTLLEIALLFGEGRSRSNTPAGEFLRDVDGNPAIQILPLSVDVAEEVAALGPALRDPADRAIVATARVHRLKLLTSDERIIDSKLVAVVG